MLPPAARTVKLGLVATDELLLGPAGGVVPEPGGGGGGPEVLGEAVLARVSVVRLARGPVSELQTRGAVTVRKLGQKTPLMEG